MCAPAGLLRATYSSSPSHSMCARMLSISLHFCILFHSTPGSDSHLTASNLIYSSSLSNSMCAIPFLSPLHSCNPVSHRAPVLHPTQRAHSVFHPSLCLHSRSQSHMSAFHSRCAPFPTLRNPRRYSTTLHGPVLYPARSTPVLHPTDIRSHSPI